MGSPEASASHAVAEIDLSALLFNLEQVKKSIGPDCIILAVVKANAYGHGAIPVARALAAAGVAMLGVAWTHEGVELRRAGVRLPILIMGGATPQEAGDIVTHRLTPVVYQAEQVFSLEGVAKKRNRRVKVHIKIDTGMGRLGVQSKKEILDLAGALQKSPHLVAEGLMTHMAEDGVDQRPFTRHQLGLFHSALDLLAQGNVTLPIRHVANSALTIDFRAAHFNMVRPGIMLYGYLPSKNLGRPVGLKPVLSLKTRIHHLKKVPPGTPLSYGRTFVTVRESLIGTLPIGYADGVPRSLSNKGEVLVGGLRVAVVGRVCMDMIMADLTGVEEVKVGDEAVLIGRQAREAITADEIAETAGTIPYEILCGIGPRVRRIYFKEETAERQPGFRENPP